LYKGNISPRETVLLLQPQETDIMLLAALAHLAEGLTLLLTAKLENPLIIIIIITARALVESGRVCVFAPAV
jgi:hypothetical protein